MPMLEMLNALRRLAWAAIGTATLLSYAGAGSATVAGDRGETWI